MKQRILIRVCLFLIGLLEGCAAPPPTKQIVITPPTHIIESSHQNIRLAARVAGLEMAKQVQAMGYTEGAIWVAPAVNRQSGEITASGREFQVLTALDLKTILGHSVVHSLGGVADTPWAWIMSSEVEFLKPTNITDNQAWFLIRLSAKNITGQALPGVALKVNANNFDATPSRFFRDAPIYLTGNYHQQRSEFIYKNTNEKEKYQNFLSIEALNQQAILDFEESRYEDSRQNFEKVLAIDKNNLPALFGLYQIWRELNEKSKYESSFINLVRAAIEQGNISFKFLFQVRTSLFRDDLDISKQYNFWLTHLANQIHSSQQCLLIQGHASKSGSQEYNDRLSHERAKHVAAQMLKLAPALKGKITTEGKGFRENLVGSGSDDAKDAIDRRVDFKLRKCE